MGLTIKKIEVSDETKLKIEEAKLRAKALREKGASEEFYDLTEEDEAHMLQYRINQRNSEKLKKENKNLIIILEGQNRCCKTTIIEKLKQAYPEQTFHILHYGKPPMADSKEYQFKLFKEMFNMLEIVPSNFILDRSHLGEAIWSPIYRNYEADEVFDLEKTLLENKHKKVVLLTIVDSNIEAHKKREDGQSFNDGDVKKHMTEISLFKKAWNKSNIKNKHFIDLIDWYKTESLIDLDSLLDQFKHWIDNK
jgi:hypothetical protein